MVCISTLHCISTATRVAAQKVIKHGARDDKASLNSLGLIYRFERSLYGTKSFFQSDEPNRKEKKHGELRIQNLITKIWYFCD